MRLKLTMKEDGKVIDRKTKRLRFIFRADGDVLLDSDTYCCSMESIRILEIET